MSDPVEDWLTTNGAGQKSDVQSAGSGDPVQDWLASGGKTVDASAPSVPRGTGYISNFLDSLSRFGSATKEAANESGGIPKAIGQAALGGVTQGPITLLKHGIEEGAYLSGQSPEKAESTANRVLPWNGYQPSSKLGQSLLEVPGAALQPIADLGSWTAKQLGLSPSAQKIGGDLAAGKAAELAWNAGKAGVGAGIKKLQGAQAADVLPNAPENSAVSKAAAQSETQNTAAQAVNDLESPNGRLDVLRRIGLDKVRKSALTNDPLAAATEAQMTRFDEPAGYVAKEQFGAERQALQGHAERLINESGGSVGMDERTLNLRGQTIAAPFDALKDYFNQATKALYNAADERSNGLPQTQLDNFGKLINTASEFEGKADNGALGRGIKSYLKEQGIMDGEGNLSPISTQQAEAVKQYINSQWSPSTSGLAGKIKNAIDKDVVQSAGEDIYQEARQLYRLKKQVLDNPSGVSKLMDYDPQTPINRATPFQNIPNAITRLSPDQFNHIVSTLKNMPNEIQPQAQAALGEIKGHFINELLDTGDKNQVKWNAKGVNNEFKANTAKYDLLFSPDELAKIHDLKDAGQILDTDMSYPGAAAQAANALKAGMMSRLIGKGLTGAGAALGGGMSGPIGGTIGAYLGNELGGKASNLMGEQGAVRKFQNRLVPIKDIKGDGK